MIKATGEIFTEYDKYANRYAPRPFIAKYGLSRMLTCARLDFYRKVSNTKPRCDPAYRD